MLLRKILWFDVPSSYYTHAILLVDLLRGLPTLLYLCYTYYIYAIPRIYLHCYTYAIPINRYTYSAVDKTKIHAKGNLHCLRVTLSWKECLLLARVPQNFFQLARFLKIVTTRNQIRNWKSDWPKPKMIKISVDPGLYVKVDFP